MLRNTMRQKSKNLILALFLVFSMISLVSAQPPFQTSTEGLQLEYPKFEYFIAGESVMFNMHVYNQTGYPLTNDTVDCYFHAYFQNGTHAVFVQMDYDLDDGDFYTIIPVEATVVGQRSWIASCNDSGTGGFVSGPAYVTPTGIEFTTSKAILYGFIFLLIGLFLVFSINGIKKSESGAWMIAYICLTYILVYVLIGVGYLISSDYLWATSIIENILYITWFIMGIGFLPFLIAISLYILGQEARAALEEEYVKQGYSREEARDLSKRRKK